MSILENFTLFAYVVSQRILETIEAMFQYCLTWNWPLMFCTAVSLFPANTGIEQFYFVWFL